MNEKEKIRNDSIRKQIMLARADDNRPRPSTSGSSLRTKLDEVKNLRFYFSDREKRRIGKRANPKDEGGKIKKSRAKDDEQRRR